MGPGANQGREQIGGGLASRQGVTPRIQAELAWVKMSIICSYTVRSIVRRFSRVNFIVKIMADICAVHLLLKKNENAPRPSEHPPVSGEKLSKRLGGIKGFKYKTSSRHLKGFPDGNNIGSTV